MVKTLPGKLAERAFLSPSPLSDEKHIQDEHREQGEGQREHNVRQNLPNYIFRIHTI
jgi:hypothetical protein